jgi:uncharacterized protein (TIGR04255 family)
MSRSKGRPVTFDEEAWPRLRFANNSNPLKVVVAQVRFPLTHALADPAIHAAIQRSLAPRFPLALDAVQEVTFAVTPQGPTSPTVEQTAIRFGDGEAQRTVAIGPAMASFETTRYVDWESFRPDVEQVLQLVAEHGAPTTFTRLGLRYVDELAIEGVATIDGWAGLLSDDLLGKPDGLLRDPRLVETSQQGRIRIADDEVRFRHGLVPRKGPNGAEGSVYVIDTDISTSVNGRWDIEALLGRLDRYHAWMTNVFGRSLTPGGIERLGGTTR